MPFPSLSRRRLLAWAGATLALLPVFRRAALAASTAVETGGLWRCGTSDCDYVYDPAEGDPERGFPPGTPFQALPADWICPNCGGPKDAFTRYHLPSW